MRAAVGCTANDIEALAENLVAAMWAVIGPKVPLDKAGQYRATFLLLAQRAVNRLSSRDDHG